MAQRAQNDTGLFWDRTMNRSRIMRPGDRDFTESKPRAPAVGKTRRPGAPRQVAGPRPLVLTRGASGWLPPTEMPIIRGQGIKRLSIDVETKDIDLNRLGPGVRRGAYIVGISIGIQDGPRYYFPMRHEAGGNMDADAVLAWARDELNGYEGELVGANSIYDLDFLAEEKITFPLVKLFHDVQVAEPIIDEWRKSYSLEAISQLHLGEGKKETRIRQIANDNGWWSENELKANLWRLPGTDVGEYAEGDADLPLRILPKQFELLEADEQMHIYDLERRLIPVILGMQRRGVRVDLNHAEHVRGVLGREVEKWRAEVKRLAGPAAELDQAESLAPALREAGVVVPLTKKSGAPSITKDLFQKNKGIPLIDAISAGRRVQTLKRTFLDGHVFKHNINGRIHCEFHQLKGERGGSLSRFSSSNPNLQNVPSRVNEDVDDRVDLGADDVVKAVRGIFLPDEGEDWWRADYSQIEYRFLAHFALGEGADEVRAKYNADPKTDYHKLCAEMLGADPEDKIKRKRIKSTNFAKGYGAGAVKLAETYGCSLDEAIRFIEEYDSKLPFAKYTYDKAQKWGDDHGRVVTILGRKQRFSLWEPAWNKDRDKNPPLPKDEALVAYSGQRIVRAMTHAALNRKLQGSNADIIKKAMVDGYEAGICDVIGAYLLTVHDELGNSVPKTDIGREAAAEMKHLMEIAIKIKVPVLVETDYGESWGATS